MFSQGTDCFFHNPPSVSKVLSNRKKNYIQRCCVFPCSLYFTLERDLFIINKTFWSVREKKENLDKRQDILPCVASFTKKYKPLIAKV